MILLPQLRWFVLMPLIINILAFGGVIYWTSRHFSLWMAQLMGWLPDWLTFLEYLLRPLFFLALAAMIFFTFTTIGNFIATPFNALLAEKVQRMEGAELPDLKWSNWLMIVPRSIGRELRKILYFLPLAIVLLILSFFVPVLGLVLWFLFNSWMMAIQYCDYAADNRSISFPEMLSRLKPKLSKSWPFGAVVNLTTMIPFINLLIIPAAVVAASLLWEREIEQSVSTK